MPGRVGALEQTIRGYADKLGTHVVEPSIGLTSDSLGEAYEFYNLYSRGHGFGTRYGKSRLNAEKTKRMQKIVCGCSVSFPIKKHDTFFLCVLCDVQINWCFNDVNARGSHYLKTVDVPM